MDIITLSTVLFIILSIIFYLPTRKVGKAIGYTVLVYVSIQIILGFVLYLDAMQLKDRFMTEEKTILLEHKNNYIAGFKAKGMGDQENVVFFNTAQINSYNGQDHKEALRNSYKLIVIKSNIFNEVETVEFSEQTFSREELFALLESDNAIDDLADIFIEAQLKEQKREFVNQFKSQLNIEDDTQLKALIFALLFSQSMQQDPLVLLKGFQENDIIIYPETATFIFIKLIPDYLITGIQEKILPFIQ
ncbi:hypothetical protein KY313_02975 [Candidatus Woesearchaeota archaeon]|nr:hypothetical protein [Candidatus Woesearchaeota archaeon]